MEWEESQNVRKLSKIEMIIVDKDTTHGGIRHVIIRKKKLEQRTSWRSRCLATYYEQRSIVHSLIQYLWFRSLQELAGIIVWCSTRHGNDGKHCEDDGL